MEYTYQKGLKLSKLSLGTVQLGVNYGINNAGGMPEEEVSHNILKTAMEGGINVLDTASFYGKSETVIGNFLKNNQNWQPTIVTKFIINKEQDVMAKSHEVEEIVRKQVEQSLKALRLNKISILMLHRENEMFHYRDVLPDLLAKLKRENLVERIGVSLSGKEQIDFIADSDLYEAVQIPLNLMDTAAVGEIEKLNKTNKIVFVRSVFLQGLFFKDPDHLPSGVLQKAAKPLRQLRRLAQEEGLEIAELAISFIRDLQGVSSLVLGCETPGQAAQNISLMGAPPLSQAVKDKIMCLFQDIDPQVVMPWTWNNTEERGKE